MLPKLKFIVLTFLLVAVFAGVAHAVSVGWVKRYAGSGAKIDVASAVATDSGGNVYVTGWSQGATSGYDFVTIKYSATGVQRWVQRYNGPGNGSDKAFAMAVDGAGNVYVTGVSWGGATTGDDWATVKYNTNGQRVWVRRNSDFGIIVNDDGKFKDEFPRAIALDGSGNIYITGSSSYYPGEPADWIGSSGLTIKYNKYGNMLWKKFSGSDRWCESLDIALDMNKNVYITGISMGTTEPFSDFIKYNTNGIVIWEIPEYCTRNSKITVDIIGNIYIISQDLCNVIDLIIKYNSNGEELWRAEYKDMERGLGDAKEIVVDKDGNVYVVGRSDSGNTTGYDYLTVKYNSNGDQQWVRRYSGPGAGEDEPTGLALDVAGNVYVTGILSMGSTTGEDWATIKYDPKGNRVWAQKYNGPAKQNDRAKAIAVDGQGNVFVTGHSYQTSTGYDYTTIKYVQ